MQISLETTGKAERRITVTVPAERVAGEMSRFGASVDTLRSGELLPRDLVMPIVQSTLQEALAAQSLRLASEPEVAINNHAVGQPLEYSASFQIYPDVELRSLAGVVVERPVVAVTDEDIGNMLTRLRSQYATWQAVERPARSGDRVVVDYEGTIDGQPYAGNRGTATELTLGAGSMVSGFEESLLGARPGEQRHAQVTFPADYVNKAVAGRRADFSVTVRSVSEPLMPALDDGFATRLGVEGGVEALRAQVRGMMENQLAQAVDARLRDQVFDALLASHDIEAPATLVRNELDRLKQQACEQQGADVSAMALPDALFETQARRQAVVGLLLTEVIREHGLQVDRERVNRRLESLALGYENPAEAINALRADAAEMKQIEGLVLEQQAVERLLEEVTLRDVPMAFFDVILG